METRYLSTGFLRKTSLPALLLPFLILTTVFLVFPAASPAKERRAAVTVKVRLNAPADAKRIDLWIPLPGVG
jgi:hypothetical protein